MAEVLLFHHAQGIENGELFLYPGEGHLFADSSLGDFDPEAAALLEERTLAFLEAVGHRTGPEA